jgi:drug/metabolite transporter, DME family
MQTSSRKVGILAVLGSALCFGTTGTTQQLGVPDISPLAVGAARLLCGSLFLFLFAYLQRGSRGSFRAPRRDLFICGLGVAIYQLTFFSAVQITGIAISTVTALGSVPTFSAIVAYFVLAERPQKSWYLGTSVTVLGIILVGTANGVDSFKPLGLLLAAIAGLGFAVFSVTSRRSLSRGAQDIWLTATSFGIAAVLTAPFLFAQNPEWILTRDGGLSVLWLGLVPTAIGYFLFTFGLKRVDSGTAATVVLAEPATATILAALVIGESLVLQSFTGIAIVVAGILYISRAKVVESQE